MLTKGFLLIRGFNDNRSHNCYTCLHPYLPPCLCTSLPIFLPAHPTATLSPACVYTYVITAGILLRDTWLQVTLTYDKDTENFFIYIDGVVVITHS